MWDLKILDYEMMSENLAIDIIMAKQLVIEMLGTMRYWSTNYETTLPMAEWEVDRSIEVL